MPDGSPPVWITCVTTRFAGSLATLMGSHGTLVLRFRIEWLDAGQMASLPVDYER
jgi:hypothetical protein